jgi:hypothetical protein
MSMKRVKRCVVVSALALAAASVAGHAGPALLAALDPEPPEESRAGDRESELYREGAGALDEEDWEAAVEIFDAVARLRGGRAEGALYWKAFALSKLGRRADALGAIAELRESHPKSRWLKEAGALEIEIQAAAGRPPRPESQADDDLRLLALSRLMESDPDRALPLVERFLSGDHSRKLKEHALFVLAQSDAPGAADLLGRVARGRSHPELQAKALQELGVRGGPEALRTLAEIYESSRSVEVKKAILQSFAISDATDRLAAAARQETDPALIKVAIQGLGVADGTRELRRLYTELRSQEARIEILQAAGVVADDAEFLTEVVRAEKDPVLRREAIRAMGVSGGRDVAPTLVALYKGETDPQTRRAVVEALFVSDNARALIDLARQETDPRMKRDIIEKLSHMDDPEVTEYMMRILED